MSPSAGSFVLRCRPPQGYQHPPKDVLARGPVGQRQDRRQELLFDGGPLRDGRRPGRPGQHGEQRDDHHRGQRMPAVDLRAWVFQRLEVRDHLVQRDSPRARHRPPPCPLQYAAWILVDRNRRSGASRQTPPNPRKSASWACAGCRSCGRGAAWSSDWPQRRGSCRGGRPARRGSSWPCRAPDWPARR